MILGKIIYASPEKHFFHIHSYYTDNDKWQKGLVFSTKEFNRIGSITNPLKKIREAEFERVRNELYNNMPSRYSCLFLSDSIKSAAYWAQTIKNRTGNIQLVNYYLVNMYMSMNKFIILKILQKIICKKKQIVIGVEIG